MKLNVSACLNLSVAIISAALLSACGGGGGGGGDAPAAPTPTPTPTPNPIVAQKCAPSNPYRFDDSSFSTTGTLADEKAWLKDNMQKNYLWYQDMPVVDASLPEYSRTAAPYQSVDAYFNALKSPVITASGAKKDKFSFTAITREWEGWYQSGVTLNYGIQWYYSAAKAPWKMTVAYVYPGSPAAVAGVQRGDQLETINGLVTDGTATNQSQVNSLLFPKSATANTFVFKRQANPVTLTISAGTVKTSPVLEAKTISAVGGNVGYMVFNEHISSAEQPLIDAINKFKADNVTSLVLDMRYNGGGYLYIASELAYMIAGQAATQGKDFARLQYNDKRTVQTALGFIPFYNTTNSNKTLPSLNLKQVFIITSADTCSASETVINGLRGIDIDVQLIGSTTCGKPYGFVGKSNCGISYFPMEFKSVNAKNFGDYADGIAPNCTAKDDFSKALGDPLEGMLSAALFRRANPNACSTPVAAIAFSGMGQVGLGAQPDENGSVARPDMMKNSFLGGRE